jgi:hypothetical protein
MAKVKWGNALDGKLNSPIVFAYAKFRGLIGLSRKKTKKGGTEGDKGGGPN